MATIQASWTKVATAEQLQRSSHNLSTVGSSVYVFGGELKPREPRDNDLHKISIGDVAKVQSIAASKDSPPARVGAAMTELNGQVYMFSGRGGVAMAPVDEQGGLWKLDPASGQWALLKPATSVYPVARSYHAMTTNGTDTIYVHAGCPENGRLSDLWAFSLSRQEWKQLATAPEPARGGTSIAFAQGKIYRMNGFDGKTEQGGSIDVYDPREDSWSTITYAADGQTGPGARSVAALIPVTISGGTSLVTLFGESDPSSLGHQGAGKMLSDIWAYSLSDGKWSPVLIKSDEQPSARGWFDADVLKTEGTDGLVVAGGLGESNERLNDLWVLGF